MPDALLNSTIPPVNSTAAAIPREPHPRRHDAKDSPKRPRAAAHERAAGESIEPESMAGDTLNADPHKLDSFA